jgi:hypothetical protein
LEGFFESHPVYDQTQGTGAVFSSLYVYLYCMKISMDNPNLKAHANCATISTTELTSPLKIILFPLPPPAVITGWSGPAATSAPVQDEAVQAVLGMNPNTSK